MTLTLEQKDIEAYILELRDRERSTGTIEQYARTLRRLQEFLRGEAITKERLLDWKREQVSRYAAKTVNCMIAAVNLYLEMFNEGRFRLRALKCQRKIFHEEELTHEEFCRLVAQAERQKDYQTATLLRTMSGSGVRVSEVKFLTVEAARQRMAVISLKGKTRQIPLGDALCRELLRFAREAQITSGPIFLSRQGRPLDRRRIWERMKDLCTGAGIDPKKVHPHALRHLFARMFYGLTKDLAKLADLLGHGSIETTRIYIVTSSREHRSILDRLTSNLSAKNPPRWDGKAKKWT